MVCCDRLPGLFVNRMESNLLFFWRSHLSIRAGLWRWSAGESAEAVGWDPPHFFSHAAKQNSSSTTHRQRAEKKMNGEANKAPHSKAVLQLSHMSYSPTMGGKPLRGQHLPGRLQKKALSVSFPWRWRVITYILPKIRICSFCRVYTNSDLQGEYRWQVIRGPAAEGQTLQPPSFLISFEILKR